MFCHKFITHGYKGPDSGRSSIELGNLVFVNDIPETSGIRPGGNTLKHNACRTCQQRSVYNVSMTRYPSYISSTPKNVAVAVLEDIFKCVFSIYHIASDRMEYTLWFSCRS